MAGSGKDDTDSSSEEEEGGLKGGGGRESRAGVEGNDDVIISTRGDVTTDEEESRADDKSKRSSRYGQNHNAFTSWSSRRHPFPDGGVLAFFRSWNFGVFLLLCSKLFYYLRLPFKSILGEVTNTCKELDLRP